MRKIYILITIILYALNGSIALADSTNTKQAELDKACEVDRQVALTPRKNEIYNECLTKFKKRKSICQDEADAYNGNRINGAPMFYELPSCEKAFEFRKKSTNK